MESAPLTLVSASVSHMFQDRLTLSKAHVHAQSASRESQKANIATAREEHEKAAGEFANASKGIGDLEVGRA